MPSIFNFEITNGDLIVRFSCSNHQQRIEETVRNLCIDTANPDSAIKKSCRYTSSDDNVRFSFDKVQEEGCDIRHEAVFFENTEYPLIVRGQGKELTEISLAINDHLRSDGKEKSTIISSGDEMYGSLNFHNQVGLTDFCFVYKVKGDNQPRELKFITEVLSFKLDYRSDLKTIISDIENEYAMLSTSFLKDTYLSMRRGAGESNPLIWWQIFKSCYSDIVSAARQIIDRPKRRLRSVPKYERAERMACMPIELENEYQIHKENTAYLYRTEELILSHDTIENRFLKYALNEMQRRFVVVKEHIIIAMHLEDPKRIDLTLENIESELLRLCNNAFFRGVGQFKGFTQDNLVMKQAQGYKTILERWIELQQGYELEEGMRKLEVNLFDAKYRIADSDENGRKDKVYDVPPPDAINQMHRYRDAIYYTEEGRDREHLKKEIIGGYVLFPGRVPLAALASGEYYYQQSNTLIGIGAFPLRPDQEQHASDGTILVDAGSSEQALRKQIRHWLEDGNGRERLLEESIPQKGLEYSDEPVCKGTYYVSSVDTHVNKDKGRVVNGQSNIFYSGYSSILSGVDFQKIKYFAPVDRHLVKGFYQVLSVEAVDMSENLQQEKAMAKGPSLKYGGFDKPIRICLKLGKYTILPKSFTYGLDSNASKGITMTRKEFQEYQKAEK